MAPLLLLISFLAFGLAHLMPGGPFDRERQPASPEIERHLEAKYHLDEPFLKQLFYTVRAPDVNMCYPPLAWQTYDIDFTAARYDAAGQKTQDALLTVRHNGEMVQKLVRVPQPTRAAPVKAGPEPGPVYLQDHGNPVVYRNIWIVEKK